MVVLDEVKFAKEVIQAFLKAKKNLRLYPSSNPIYIKIVEDTYKKIEEFFEFQDELKLRITRNEIFLGSDPVFQGAGKDENLALFFFKDGLRELTFKRGLTEEELQEFLEILAFDFEKEDVEDDVVTLLWDKDFQHIKYRADDTVLIEDEGYEEAAVEQVKEKSASEGDLAKAYEDALKAEDVKEVNLMSLTDSDLKALLKDIEADSSDKRQKMIDILFEMLRRAESLEEYGDISQILRNAIGYYVRHGELEGAVGVLKRTKEFVEAAALSVEQKRELNRIFSYASSSEVLKVMGELLDSEFGVNEAVFDKYISFVDKSAIPHLISLLGDLKTIGGRKNIINALAFLGSKDLTALAKGLRDERWYVVRNVIYVFRKIGDRRAIDYLVKMAKHSDIRVRKEVLRALGEFGGDSSAQIIKDYLDDPERSVRTAAVRALGSIGTLYAKSAVLGKISDRQFLSVEFSEKKEYFEVLSRWKDTDVFDFLMKILKSKSLFRRSKHNELKACAAYSLGLMGSKDSLPVLEKLKESSNKLLSEYASSAIRRIEQHGQ
jgi:hypothetical protein